MQKIKTNLKFQKGLNGVADKMYGFVTKVNGSWRGCHESDIKKKIVFIDSAITEEVLPNTLYKCSLIPMSKSDGFIVKSLSLVKFKAIIQTVCNGTTYKVSVVFGNKSIVYDPSSHIERHTNISKIANIIRSRVDLQDAMEVAEEFISTACMVRRLYEQSLESKPKAV